MGHIRPAVLKLVKTSLERGERQAPYCNDLKQVNPDSVAPLLVSARNSNSLEVSGCLVPERYTQDRYYQGVVQKGRDPSGP